MVNTKSVHIGTSGWHYSHWKGPFYPRDLPDSRLLEHYVKYFDTTEINNTFYNLPENKTFVDWRISVPADFIFAVKASRYITHMKKLKDPEQPVNNLVNHASNLQNKLGPILFQLPDHWKVNPERLKVFIQALPAKHRYAFEFRDSSWFDEKIKDELSKNKASFCIYDFDHRESPQWVTSDFIFVRLHGPEGPYKGKYDKLAISRWGDAFKEWNGQGKEVFCYFDNDENGYAAQNALELKDLLKAK